jgi:hypothetical protein
MFDWILPIADIEHTEEQDGEQANRFFENVKNILTSCHKLHALQNEKSSACLFLCHLIFVSSFVKFSTWMDAVGQFEKKCLPECDLFHTVSPLQFCDYSAEHTILFSSAAQASMERTSKLGSRHCIPMSSRRATASQVPSSRQALLRKPMSSSTSG